MLKLLSRGAAGIVVMTGITVTWSPYHSTLYPYTISQPSSFKHAVLSLSSDDERVDYFSPALGSATTNVTVSAQQGGSLQPAVEYLRSLDGHHIRQSGWIEVLGQLRPLMRADFNGYTGKWTIEEVNFTAQGYNWRVSCSYAARYSKLRSLMLRMIRSFKLLPSTHAK